MTSTNVYVTQTDTAIYSGHPAATYYRVTIATDKAEVMMTNEIQTITTASNDNVNASVAKVVNINKITIKFTITGHIVTGLNPNASNPVEHTDADDIYTDLWNMFLNKNQIYLFYRGTSYVGTMDTLKLTSAYMEGNSVPDSTIGYDVVFTFIYSTLMNPAKS